MLEVLTRKIDKVNMVDTNLVRELVSVIIDNISDITTASIFNVSNFVEGELQNKSILSWAHNRVYRKAKEDSIKFKRSQTCERDKVGAYKKETYVQQIVDKFGEYYLNLIESGKAIIRTPEEVKKLREMLGSDIERVLPQDFKEQRAVSPIKTMAEFEKAQKQLNDAIKQVKAQVEILGNAWNDSCYTYFKEEIEKLLSLMTYNNYKIWGKINSNFDEEDVSNR